MENEVPEGESNLVKCDITGEMVPEDETIVLEGYRVGAKGKEILLERLRSGEGAPGEMERPSVLTRGGAWILDGILLWILFFGVRLGLGHETGETSVAYSLIVFAILLLYYTLCHGMGGQTAGKMAGKIKVVRLDGKPIGLGRAALRTLYYLGGFVILVLGGLVVGLVASPARSQSDLETVGAIILGLTAVAGAYALIDMFLALFDGKRQRSLHDRLAGTRVIRLN